MPTNPTIPQATSILRAGGLVAMPTETVYGLAADATNPQAIARIFSAKGRPTDHPLIVHLATLAQLKDWANDIPTSAYKLAAAFWPGPLTMILKKQPSVLPAITGGQETVGIRIPSHPVAQALLQAFGGGLAAPSANRFTHLSPTTAAAVKEELGDKVDLILDGGDCEIGLESTIIDLSSAPAVILRPGMISQAEIETILGCPVITRRQDVPSEVRVPGMHHLHYAPTTPVRIVRTEELTANLAMAKLPIAVLSYSKITVASEAMHHVCLANNAKQYAHDLYHVLRKLDHLECLEIIIEAVPNAPEWEAVRDRLSKATRR